jgi:precorrin-3B synthase
MNSAASIEVKGWCPGALRPMLSGDGLIVRIRPFCGAFSLEQARGLADLARRLGNGHIDLTRRANLQLRGLVEERLPELHAALGKLDLIDPDAETEAKRNLMVAPLAGLDPVEKRDVRPIARAIAEGLATDERLRALPAKFGLLVDGGGTVSIAAERADIALLAIDAGIALGLDMRAGTQWLGAVSPDTAAPVALLAARAFLDAAGPATRLRLRGLPADGIAQVVATLMPMLRPCEVVRSTTGRTLGAFGAAVGVAAPFGRLEAEQLRCLSSLAEESGATELRSSPWRTVYFGARDAAAAWQAAEAARLVGLIVDTDDPLLRIEACPGAPDCKSSSVDARGDARRLAALAAAQGYDGSIHVSGCAKGCARSAPSELVLVGKAGRYHLVRNATTRGPVERIIGTDEFPALFEGSRDV